MSFIIDKQTLGDLAIFSSRKEQSIFGIFNSTATRGGSAILNEMFSFPLDNATLIKKRSSIIEGFRVDRPGFPFRPSSLDAAEAYISESDERTKLSDIPGGWKRSVRKSAEFQKVLSGITGIISIMKMWKSYTGTISGTQWGADFTASYGIDGIMDENSGIFATLPTKDGKKLPLRELCALDDLLRYENRGIIRRMLDFLYICDVYNSVATVALEKGFTRAEISESPNILDIKDLWHPFLSTPVSNDFYAGDGKNIVFLTGANMAGKSTFMKALGIAVYLAHVGFPVPALSMKFSPRAGLFTTINLPDDINKGYSHFYAEVRRLKRVAQTVGTYRNMVIIFDELFRGTNVRDAFDATVAVAETFSFIKESVFMISTHIIEAGDELKKKCESVKYVYLPTVIGSDGKPEYTYKLCEGITGDRHGMMIIRREGIINILEQGEHQ